MDMNHWIFLVYAPVTAALACALLWLLPQAQEECEWHERFEDDPMNSETIRNWLTVIAAVIVIFWPVVLPVYLLDYLRKEIL